MLVLFNSPPNPTTILSFNINIAAVGTGYISLGVTDFSHANAQVTVSQAQPAAVGTIPFGTATFAKQAVAQAA